ncbi:hypothetical protein CMEL01_15696 [Colletotrichum melonis]|uniref:Uncharacterized protein n=1 Tax=Colletotrichum melonis TaxID=1209925 RepID=A0AAI9UFZ4_9PEZI|nr:hypothetical protein CMEL01_15696 [Colletotrichum melonis]
MKPPVYSIGFFWQRSNTQCEVTCLFFITLPALRRQGEGDHAIQEQRQDPFPLVYNDIYNDEMSKGMSSVQRCRCLGY